MYTKQGNRIILLKIAVFCGILLNFAEIRGNLRNYAELC